MSKKKKITPEQLAKWKDRQDGLTGKGGIMEGFREVSDAAKDSERGSRIVISDEGVTDTNDPFINQDQVLSLKKRLIKFLNEGTGVKDLCGHLQELSKKDANLLVAKVKNSYVRPDSWDPSSYGVKVDVNGYGVWNIGIFGSVWCDILHNKIVYRCAFAYDNIFVSRYED